ncbi:MAG TPA: helix-turn-helix domain-containing protein, partial [Pseudonocardiaceae bacterium]|nr:helix-turn-helix domain-containing protein [Pseudonocardiaceae bacterium]
MRGIGMPRPERPLDPDAGGALARWAVDLRALREAAGNPGYRDLARRAHFSYSTLADAAGGQKLPSLAVATAFVRACGGDVDQWRTRWQVLAAELAADTGQPDAPVTTGYEVSPYRGLAAFQLADADWFFGRTELVRELADRIAEQRFVGVFGPSGSGKSSLLRAGLLPSLAHQAEDRPAWRTVVFTPGDHPLTECAVHLGDLLRIPAGEV